MSMSMSITNYSSDSGACGRAFWPHRPLRARTFCRRRPSRWHSAAASTSRKGSPEDDIKELHLSSTPPPPRVGRAPISPCRAI